MILPSPHCKMFIKYLWLLFCQTCFDKMDKKVTKKLAYMKRNPELCGKVKHFISISYGKDNFVSDKRMS